MSNPLKLNSIAKDLIKYDQKNNTNTYWNFKNSVIGLDSNLKREFDKVELNMVDNIAMLTLGTNNLDWVNLKNNILIKKEWKFTIEATENKRNLSLNWSDYKLESKINSKNKIQEINKEANKKLNPINEDLNLLTKVLTFFKDATKFLKRFCRNQKTN